MWPSAAGHPFMIEQNWILHRFLAAPVQFPAPFLFIVLLKDKTYPLPYNSPFRWTPYVAPFPARHTGKSMSLGLDAIIQELGLEVDQWELFCVNDNADIVELGIKIFQYLNQNLCDSHNLDLCIKDTFKNVTGMKNLFKKNQRYWHLYPPKYGCGK